MITMIIKRGLEYRSDPWKTDDTYNSWKHTFMLFRNSCGSVFFVVCTTSSIWKIPADTVLLCFNIHQCVPRNNGAHLDPQCECISQLMDWIYQLHWWMVRDMFPFGLALLQKNNLPTDPHCQGEELLQHHFCILQFINMFLLGWCLKLKGEARHPSNIIDLESLERS